MTKREEIILNDNFKKILLYANLLVGNTEAAMDITKESFAKLFETISFGYTPEQITSTLYEYTSEACSAYWQDTLGFDPIESKKYFLFIIKAELIYLFSVKQPKV